MKKIKIDQAVIVEGKYDKIKLSALIDAVIITTDGFRIFKDAEMSDLIRRYAESSGIVILTDSDAAGFRIRGHIKSICPEGKITNLYIPDIFGKEKRKTEPSKEGKLGVEGMDAAVLKELFDRAGITSDKKRESEPLTAQDLYDLGLSGGSDSSTLRRKVAAALSLPERITAKGLLDAANTLYSRKEFCDTVIRVKGEEV